MARQQVRFDLSCSVNEFRRLIGQPDLVPLAEWAAAAQEAILLQAIRRYLDDGRAANAGAAVPHDGGHRRGSKSGRGLAS